MGAASSIGVSGAARKYADFQVTSFASLSSNEIDVALDKLPALVSPTLRKAMLLLGAYGAFRKNFLLYFGTGRWVNEFLDSNTNILNLLYLHDSSKAMAGAFEEEKSYRRQGITSTTSSFVAATNTKLIVMELRTDDPTGKLTSQGKVQQSSSKKKWDERIDWVNYVEGNQKLLAILLAVAFPIYLLSDEFEFWLEFREKDTEESMEIKRKVEKESAVFRKSGTNADFSLDEFDNSAPAITHEVILNPNSEKIIKFVHQRHSGRGNLAELANPRAISMRKRTKAIIQRVLGESNPSHMEHLLSSTAWTQQFVLFLDELPIPIVIGRAKVASNGSKLGLLSRFNREQQYTVVYSNKAYETLTDYSLSDVYGLSLYDLLLGKNTRVLTHHSLDNPACVIAESQGKELDAHMSLLQWTVETSKKGSDISFTGMLLMKAIHHVAAEPSCHFVVATMYDLSPKSTRLSTQTTHTLSGTADIDELVDGMVQDDVDVMSYDGGNSGRGGGGGSVTSASQGGRGGRRSHTNSAIAIAPPKNNSLIPEPAPVPLHNSARDSQANASNPHLSYAQFHRDLPMIEDMLNLVPQFLY